MLLSRSAAGAQAGGRFSTKAANPSRTSGLPGAAVHRHLVDHAVAGAEGVPEPVAGQRSGGEHLVRRRLRRLLQRTVLDDALDDADGQGLARRTAGW